MKPSTEFPDAAPVSPVRRRSGRPPQALAVPREHILASAARLFRERGYQATTVRDIAADVGMLSGSLFHHFASKEQMLVEMLREASLTMCVDAEAIVALGKPPDATLAELVRFELACFAGPSTRDIYGVLVSEWRDVPPAMQSELSALRRRYAAIIDAVLQSCHEQGLLRCPPDVAARVIHGVNTSAVVWFRGNGRYSVQDFADATTALLLQPPAVRSPSGRKAKAPTSAPGGARK